jgi:hypothetical protein
MENVLLVSSIDATCFGRADHPQALKYMILQPQVKMRVDILKICEISQIIQAIH